MIASKRQILMILGIYVTPNRDYRSRKEGEDLILGQVNAILL